MSRQIADDPGRQIRKVWLGPVNSWRWPMDWTFEEWGLGFVSWIVGAVLLCLVIPAGAVIGAGTFWAARTISRVIAPEEPRRTFWTVIVSVAVLCLLISTSPTTWVLPIWLPLAAALSFGVPFLVVRTWGGYVDWNRPIAYWMRLPRLVASGPRQRDEDEIDPARLALDIDLENASHDRDLDPKVTPPPPPKSKHAAARPKPVKAKITKVAKPKRERFIAATDRGHRIGATEIAWRY